MERTFEVAIHYEPDADTPGPTADDVELAIADKLGDDYDDLIVTVKPL